MRGDGPNASEAEACAGVQAIGRLANAELAVLRGLATGLLRREVGVQRHVSVNTVTGHAHELYASWT